jgi:hypothetical protein
MIAVRNQRRATVTRRIAPLRIPQKRVFLFRQPEGLPFNINAFGGGEARVVQIVKAIGGGSTSHLIDHSFDISVSGGGSISKIYDHDRTISISGGGSVASFYESISAVADLACYVLSTDTERTVTFTNYDFKGYGRFNQKLIAVKNDGVFDLETVATDDDGTAISCHFEFKTNFGALNYAQLRRLFVDANVKVTIYDDADTILQTIESLSAYDNRGVSKDNKDEWIKIKIENISGAIIEITRIHGNVEHRGHKGV